MSDFGRVGYIKSMRAGYGGGTDCTFMVIGPAFDPLIRDGKKSYRHVMVLEGVGYDSSRRLPGDIGAITLDDPDIEWLG